jgi:steroid delta-isomerase-like uncharacterized protein
MRPALGDFNGRGFLAPHFLAIADPAAILEQPVEPLPPAGVPVHPTGRLAMPRLFIPAAVAFALLASTAVAAQDGAETEAIVRDYMGAWSSRDVDRIVSFFAPDGVYEDVTNVGNGWASPWEGRAAIREAVTDMYVGIPDLALETHSIRSSDGSAVLEWTMTGTHTGDWENAPATGRSFSVRGVSVLELDDGAIRHQRDYWDGFRFSSQLGLLPGEDGGREAANEALIRQVIEEGVNAHDVDAFRRALAPGYVRHSQATTAMPEIRGIDAMLEFLQATFTAFPDWHEEIVLMVAEGDKVAYVTRGTATHTGPMDDVPATGNRVEVMNYIFQRIEDGKIAETWVGWDNLAVLRQLGLMPDPGAGGQ